MKIGFIGLGHLGKAIATRMRNEGLELVVWNRTADKAAGLDAERAESPSAVAKEAETIFINLFDSEAVQSVLTSGSGLLEGDVGGKVIVDTTTNHFGMVGRFSDACRDKGAVYLESPVLGSVAPALQGALTVLVSGEKSAYEKVNPLLQKIGKHIFYLGDSGRATKMKLINNLALGVFMASIAEAVVFGEEIGLKREEVLDILAAGAGNSLVLNAKRDKILKEDFSTAFSSALIHKDLHYLGDLARDLKRPLFTGSIAEELYGMTFSKGIEKLDFSAIYKVFREI